MTLQAYRQGTKFLLLIAALQYAVIYPGRRNLPGVRVTWMRSTWRACYLDEIYLVSMLPRWSLLLGARVTRMKCTWRVCYLDGMRVT